jgi:glycosyltransferase involved in cell wall biosynthesis
MLAQQRHILFLIPTLGAGGAERVIVTLLNHFDRSKFRLTLAVLDMRGAAFFEELPSGITVLDLQSTRVRYALPKIIRLIWKIRPDVAFSTLGHLNLALAMVRPLLPSGTRYVARETITVSEDLRTRKLAKAWGWAYRNFYGRFDHIICQSDEMRADLAANFRLPPQKLALINNPVDVERIARLASSVPTTYCDYAQDSGNKDVINFVAAGRLVYQKGFDLLIEAVARSGLKQLMVTVLGAGPLRETLEQLAREKGVHNQVRFAGLQKNPYAFMAGADAFVLCSRYEGFPNVMLEALACGTCVIATPAPGGTAEIARSTRGVQLASAVSAEALSAEFQRFVSNRPNPAHITVERFEAGRIAKEYENVFIGNAQGAGTRRHDR